MLEFIETYDDLVVNVKTFNECIINSDLLISRLNQFKQWYYIEELNQFAPSKFIGYKGNNPEEYRIGTEPVTRYMDGRNTERVLRGLFNEVQYEGHEIQREKLIEFLNEFGAIPNANVHIHLISIKRFWK